MTDIPLEDLPKYLDEKREAVMDAVYKAMRLWAMDARGQAKKDAPKREHSGRLASSITSNVTRDDEQITAVIGTNVYYAPYNEYGTGDRGSNVYNGHVSDEVTFTAGWPGMDPHPYLRPQIYDHETEIIGSVMDAVRKAIR